MGQAKVIGHLPKRKVKKGLIKPVVKKGYVIRPLTQSPFKSALEGLKRASRGIRRKEQ